MQDDSQTNSALDLLSDDERKELIKPGSYYDADDFDDQDIEFFNYAKGLDDTNPFRRLILEDGPTYDFFVPMRYSWANSDPLVREFAEKVGFPKDRDILIYCWFCVNQVIEVDNCFILDEDDSANLDDISICFADFPEMDFRPLYDLVAEDALKRLSEHGYDMTGFHQ